MMYQTDLMYSAWISIRNSRNTVNEALFRKYDAFNFNLNHAGVSNGNGLAWQNIRRFSVRHMRDLGMGKSSLEAAILIEIEKVLQDFKKYEDKPNVIPYSLTLAILNIIWEITAGREK